jgi:GT2 family glycosyltransferase
VSPGVSAIIVGYGGEPEELGETIASLKGQTRPPSQIVCVDQSADGRFERFLARAQPGVEVLRQEENIGYPSACNLAARRARGEHLLFINPDARAREDCLEVLAGVLDRRPEAAIAGAQILLPDGRVNAGDNVLHLSGLAWAGRYGLAPEVGPERPAAVVSGAALMVRRSVFEAIGGYTEGFFMYHDDVELAWRCRLAGHEVLFCPRADVVHDYEYSKGGYKWRYMERNRWWCLLAHLESRTLLTLAPLLLAVEAAIWIRAAGEGWLGAKLGAYRSLWTDRHSLRARRREIQASRRIGDRPILERMRATVESPFLASPAVRAAEPALRAYRRVVLKLAR